MRDPLISRCDLVPQYRMYQSEIASALNEVLLSGKYTLGEQVKCFESEFSGYIGLKYGVGVNNGTDALILALECQGIGPGDEVILPVFTAIPTYSAVLKTGAKPVFVDIDPQTYLLDITQVSEALTARTKAIVPVHLFGSVVDVPALRSIVGPNIRIIEDCAQSHGATLKGKKAGSFGNAAAFSFYPTKNLGAYGDGGMVVTDDGELAHTVRLKRMYGMVNKDEITCDGINTRLDELQAAVLRVKLKHLDHMNQCRQALAKRYGDLLNPDWLIPQRIAEGIQSVHHVYCPRLQAPEKRNALLNDLEQCGIQATVFYPKPLNRQEAYVKRFGRPERIFPAAQSVCESIICLPFYPEIPEQHLERVAKAIEDFFKGKKQ